MRIVIFIFFLLFAATSFGDQIGEHIEKGFQYNDAGQVKKAIVEFEKALALDPKNPDIIFTIGALKGCPDSIDYYKKAIDLDEKLVDAYNNLGSCYEQINDLENALKYYKKLLVFEPNNITINYNVGNFLSGQNKYKEAIDHYLTVLKLKPDHYWAENNLGIAYTSLDKYDLALEALRRAIGIDKSLSPAYLNMYNAYSLKNMEKEGKVALEKGGLQALRNNNTSMINAALQMLKNHHPNSKLIPHLEKKLNEKPNK